MMSANHLNGSQEAIAKALASITAVVREADTKNGGVTIINEVYVCTDDPGLLPGVNAELKPWLTKHIATNFYRFKPLKAHGINKEITLKYLTDENKQLIKKKNKECILKCKIAKGLIIPIDQNGNLLDGESFAKLIYSN